MHTVFWTVVAWVLFALVQALLGDYLATRRLRRERDERDRQELRNLCNTIQTAESRREHRRWSKQ